LNIKKILLVHLQSNGDCLYATAIARQIKQDYPGVHLTWVIASFCKNIIDNNPYVDDTIVIDGVNRNTSTDITRNWKKIAQQKIAAGEYDKAFFTQIIDSNLANYDGTVRSAILRAYGKPITVPLTPVLRLRDHEIANAKNFAEKYKLANFKNVILFEFAPQSGQLAITPEIAMGIAETLTALPNTCIILSSNIKIGDANPKIIDGSALTLRETAHLTHYCTLLLGCSSGITWISTSEAAKQLPMVQMLDPDAFWVNPISRDFERCGFSQDYLIELYENNPKKLTEIISCVFAEGFAAARAKYYKPLPIQFKTTSRSIYNMLCLLQFGAIFKHIRINIGVFGWHPLLFWEIFVGFATAPYKLVSNTITKRLKK
jgi:hypothetical protein